METGAVTLCLPQDVQAEAYDYPVTFFLKNIFILTAGRWSERSVREAVTKIRAAKNPLIIAGGGVHYSLACK